MDPEKKFEPLIFTLVDEEEKEHQFELIDKLELNDTTYYAMTPVLSDPNALKNFDGELIILKGEWDGNEELLITIDDEEEYNQIGHEFLKRLDQSRSEDEDH